MISSASCGLKHIINQMKYNTCWEWVTWIWQLFCCGSTIVWFKATHIASLRITGSIYAQALLSRLHRIIHLPCYASFERHCTLVDTDIFEWNELLQKFWLQVSHNILRLTASTLYTRRISWWTYMWHPMYLQKSGSGEYISKEWLIVNPVTWKVMLHIRLFIQVYIQNYAKMSSLL